ncbi:YitT family protein [Gemmiger formicilis]|uniref:YczE/YyaS/YitT family protein n=1 Tax=Gemmiger formicilis TaxID=745368 RepID=UPI0019596195|nr:DUF6198 family protein [Gemmiger formicilis]MBM6717942.1 YitT family protein [Gemmiger formicilis]
MKTVPKHMLRRCLLLVVGLVIMAFGVAFSIKAGLGTSPISSLPYVLSLLPLHLTVGTATIAMHVTLIILQILLLRRRYDPFQLAQLPVALVFGSLTDFSVWALQDINVSAYPARWVLCIIGILLVGVGVSFEVTANVVTLAGEGMVLAVCKVFPVPFGNAKIGFDVTLVVIASVLSLLFLGGLYGVREGTVAAAFCVGLVARQVNRPMRRFAQRFLD